jgi:hypothetical protein
MLNSYVQMAVCWHGYKPDRSTATVGHQNAVDIIIVSFFLASFLELESHLRLSSIHAQMY